MGLPRLLAFLLVALLLAPAPSRAKVFDPKSFTLKNGMRVVVIENHRAPVVTHMVWYKVGAADEPAGKSGIAHFFEHLMFKGTKKFPGRKFSDLVAKNGGNENAFTSWDYTGYHQTIASDRLEMVMEMEADRMTNLILTDKVIEPERQVILEERNERIDTSPHARLGEQARAAFYRNHPYAIPIIGWRHEVEALTRQDLIDFYETWYRPNNAILVVIGDVSVKQVRALANKYYGVIPRGDVPKRIRPSEPPHEGEIRISLADPRVRVPSWSRRVRAPGYGDDKDNQAYALELLAEILGGNATSLLYRKFAVNGGPALSVGAYYDPDNLDGGEFILYARPKPDVSIEALEKQVLDYVAELLEEGFDADEVARARKQMVRSAIFARDNPRAGGNIFGRALTTGQTIKDVEAWPKRIGAVTVERVNEAARQILGKKGAVVAILLPEAKSKTDSEANGESH